MLRIWLAAMTAATGVFAADPAPTFYKDILPIIQKNCQSCHRPGEIGPMPLLTYEQARPYARAIKRATESKKMPPWFADSAVQQRHVDLRARHLDARRVGGCRRSRGQRCRRPRAATVRRGLEHRRSRQV